jgi:uncharacterized protein YyaL (SSP411 family)
LSLLTGDPKWLDEADSAIARFGAQMQEHPAAFPALLTALDVAEGPSQEVLVAGEDATAREMTKSAQAGFHPRRVVLVRRDDTSRVAPWTRDYPAATAAYVCSNHACKAPARTVAELRGQLGA